MIVEFTYCNHIRPSIMVSKTKKVKWPNYWIPTYRIGPEYPGAREHRFVFYWLNFSLRIEWGF